MKNPFQEIKDRKAAEARQRAEEQRLREERLRQLEESQKRSGFHIPNPIKIVKGKKEMKALRKEIATYKEQKRNKKVILGCVSVLVALSCFIGIMTVKEHATKNDIPAADFIVEETQAISSDSEELETSDNSLAEATEQISHPVEITEPETNESETQHSFSTDENKEIIASAVEFPQITASDLVVNTITDYAHTVTDTIFLGENEGVTITIKAPSIGITKDDIIIVYDESLLNAEIDEPYDQGNNTVFKVYVTGKTTCQTNLAICTAYDIATLGEDATGYLLDIWKLDPEEGRIAYVTPYGEKYHFSESCAGENAIKTTYRDAIANDYEPCSKCAK